MDKRDRLIELIKILKLPFLPEEADIWVKNLKDENIVLLVSIYEDIQRYKNNLNSMAKKVDPEKYGRLEKEYEEKLKAINNEYLKKTEEIEVDTDKRLDALYNENEKKVNDGINKLYNDIETAEKNHESLHSNFEDQLSRDQQVPSG